MPDVYLSPSTQDYNPYIIGGSEKYYMNLLADAMEPYLFKRDKLRQERPERQRGGGCRARGNREETIGSISPCTLKRRARHI